MHELHPHQNLAHVVLDVVHWDEGPLLLCILDDLFEVLLAELEHQVLHHFALVTLRVVNVEQLHDVFAAFESVEYFEFSRDIFTTLACSLDCHRLSSVRVNCLEHVACKETKRAVRFWEQNLPKLPEPINFLAWMSR